MNARISSGWIGTKIDWMEFDPKDEGKFYKLNRYCGGGCLTEHFPFGGIRDVAFVFVVGPDLKLWQIPPSNFEVLRQFRGEVPA